LGNIRSDIREFKVSSSHCNFCSFKEALKNSLLKILMGYKYPLCNMWGLKCSSFNTTNSFPIANLTFSLLWNTYYFRHFRFNKLKKINILLYKISNVCRKYCLRSIV
jgi:hypothetical protein